MVSQSNEITSLEKNIILCEGEEASSITPVIDQEQEKMIYGKGTCSGERW